MLPAGLVKASPAASTPAYYMAWSDAFIAVDFEAITLPLLFSTEDVYRGYFGTMRKIHSRKVSEWDRMNVHYARAKKCYRNGQFVECVTALQHACLLRRDIFVANDYQVGAAYEHAAWAAVHLALIRIGETDGKRSAANNNSNNSENDGSEDDDGDDAEGENDNDDDSEDLRRRKLMDTHNPNEVPKLFAIAEDLLKSCSAKKRSPFTHRYNNTINQSTYNNNRSHNVRGGSAAANRSTSVGGGVVSNGYLNKTDIAAVAAAAQAAHMEANASSASATTMFPNKSLLEFVLFHNFANYWVRRRKWKAARKYTALAEARFRTLSSKGLVASDDVVPSHGVNGATAMECFLRCRSELVRLRSQFVAGNALSSGESLLYQKPLGTNPRNVGISLNGQGGGGAASTSGVTNDLSGTFSSANNNMTTMNGGAESFLSGFSLGTSVVSGAAASGAGANAGVVSIAIAQSMALVHEPLLNRRLLPSTLCGDAVALAAVLEEAQREQQAQTDEAEAGEGEHPHEHDGVVREGGEGPASTVIPSPQQALVDGIIHWLRADKRSAVSEGCASAAMATVASEDRNDDDDPSAEDAEHKPAAGSDASLASFGFLSQFPFDVPLVAVLPYLLKDLTFNRLTHERRTLVKLLAEEKARQAEEQRAYDESVALINAYEEAAKRRQKAVDEGVPKAELPPLPPTKPDPTTTGPNKMANVATVERYESSIAQCTAAMDGRATDVAQRLVEHEGFLKLKVWCSPNDATPPPPLTAGLEAINSGDWSAAPSMAATPSASTNNNNNKAAHTSNNNTTNNSINNTSSNGNTSVGGMWCDVAISFVVARREYSAPDHWSPLLHTIPFIYHYTSAVLAYNDRKFALGLGHLDRCARIVLATGEEAAPIGKLQGQRRRWLKDQAEAKLRREQQQQLMEAQKEDGDAAASASPSPASNGPSGVEPLAVKEVADQSQPQPDLSAFIEVNPFWWEKGVVTLRHHCVEGPSLDFFSKYNTTKKTIHNPIESLRKQIMVEHVTADQARKRRQLQEEVMRNRMLRDEDGDLSIVDAIDASTGRPAWALAPSVAESTSIVNDLAEYSDTLRLWRDRRRGPGGVPLPARGPSAGPAEEEGEGGAHDGSDNEEGSRPHQHQPPSTAPAENSSANLSGHSALAVASGASPNASVSARQTVSNPSSDTLQKLTFAQQKQVRGRPLPTSVGSGGGGASSHSANVSSGAGNTTQRSNTPQSIRRRPFPQALPMLRELAGDVLVASKLRRQLHLKQRSGSADANNRSVTPQNQHQHDDDANANSNDNDTFSSAASAVGQRSTTRSLAPSHATTTATLAKSTATAPNNAQQQQHQKASSNNIFLAVHNVLVDSLVKRQEEQLASDERRRAMEIGGAAVENEASADVPAPSSGAFGDGDGEGMNTTPPLAPGGGRRRQASVSSTAASFTTSVPPNNGSGIANAARRRASLFVLEEKFTDERKSVVGGGRRGSAAGATRPTTSGSVPHSNKPVAASSSSSLSPRNAPLLSLYATGEPSGSSDPSGKKAGSASAHNTLGPLDKTPLRISVAMPTEEEASDAALFGVSAARKATTVFGSIKPSALLPTPQYHQSPAISTTPTPVMASGGSPNRSTGSGIVGASSTSSSRIALSVSPLHGTMGHHHLHSSGASPYAANAASASPSSSGAMLLGSGGGTSPSQQQQPKGQFRIDTASGTVVGSKRYNLVPHIETISEKQHALRAMLPAVDFKEQRDLYRTIMAELAENEEILRLRRVEMQQRVLRYEADKLRLLAVQQQQQRAEGITSADVVS